MTSKMLRPLFSMLSPAGARGRLSVLIFHRVLRQPDPLLPGEMHAQRFDRVCRWLADWFNVLPLDEAVGRLRDGLLPARAAAITFDDGYADNHDVALPILQRHGLTATFFITSGFLDGGRMWNDTVIEAVRGARASSLDVGALGLEGLGRVNLHDVAHKQAAIDRLLGAIKYLEPAGREAVVAAFAAASGAVLPDNLMMTSGQVMSLRRAGMPIGAHTVTHPILAKLSGDAVQAEVVRGKHMLENIVQTPVTLFAYPNGKPDQDYSAATVQLVRKAGFHAAVSTAWGVAQPGSDCFQLPRFTPWDRSHARFGLRLLSNMRRAGDLAS